MSLCNLDWKIQGPYNQTLFLGCSVSDFSMNLGWGADASTCTIKLVRDISKHPSHPTPGGYQTFDTNLAVLTSNNTANSTVFDPQITSPDNSKSLTKNVAQKLLDSENDRKNTDTTDTGKIYYEPNGYPKYWTKIDPGFIGRGKFGITGCGVYFRFHNLAFGGYIKKWTENPNGTFDVELSSFSSLLSGCKLILQQYRGSISTLLNTSYGMIAVPYAGPSVGKHTATIAQGNIPNVFNVFGWLESADFGYSQSSERGIPGHVVYKALQALLGSSSPQTGPFSPYGAIVAKGVTGLDDNKQTISLLDTTTVTTTIEGAVPSAVGPTLSECGFLPTRESADGEHRCLLRLDISEVPMPPATMTFNQAELSIMDFITTCCKEAGYDFFVDLEPGNNSFSGTIKIRTISRRIQPPANILRKFFYGLSGTDGVISASVGEEFSDSDIRSIIIGGPQERLYQVCSHTLSRYRNYNRFDPEHGVGVAGYDVNLDTNQLAGNFRNTLRMPLASRTRWYNYGSVRGRDNLNNELAGAVAQEDGPSIYFSPQKLDFSGMSVYTGSYETLAPALGRCQDAEVPPEASNSYPIYADLISPYFGRDSHGNIRKVFFDTKMSQLQVLINVDDIRSCLPTAIPYRGYFVVYENELRAALSGIDNWLTYIADTGKLGTKTPTTSLIFEYLSRTYGGPVAKSLFMSGLGVIRSGGKPSAMPSIPPTNNPLSPESAIPYSSAIMDTLDKLYNFFRDLASKHYGKDFLVRLPLVKTAVDPQTGVRQYEYTIAESGWEEPGNFIDDTIPIGTTLADSLMGEDGKFGVILGYNNMGEKYSQIDGPKVGLKGLLNALRGSFFYNQPYLPLYSDIDPSEVYVVEWKTPDVPRLDASDNPMVSRNPIVSNEALLTGANLPGVYRTGFNDNIEDSFKFKCYVKGSCIDAASENKYNKKMIYRTDSNCLAPYCVVSAPGPVWIRSPRSLLNVMIEDLILANNSRLSRNRLLLLWLAMDRENRMPGMINSSLPSNNSIEIAPRAALPCFASVPIKMNLFTYGPWTSHPHLVGTTTFPGCPNPDIPTNNIIGGVKVEIDSDLVPWNYGGIEGLDTAVLNRIAADNSYQQIIENGNLTYAGIQLGSAGIGYRLLDNNMGPVINSIIVAVGADGIKTTLSLRTYSRKLGFYNKETSDTIARIGKESIRRRKDIADNIRNLTFAAQREISSDFSNSRPKALNWSPVSILVGNAYPLLHHSSSINTVHDPLGLNYTPSWHLRPQIPPNITSSPQNLLRHQTHASIYDQGEIAAVFKDADYGSTSIMSMDGLISPISFYPTPHGTTYAIAPYTRSKCPYCKGKGTFTYDQLDFSKILDAGTDTFTTLRAKSSTTKTISCQFCVPDSDKNKALKQSVRPTEFMPPFIVASGTDLAIINSKDDSFANDNPIINRYTLNPIVMSSNDSEFNCRMNKQAGDSCAHTIDAVAFGSSLDDIQGGLRPALSDTIANNYANHNVRFFGLRGPVMVHAWGYDTEGYPVPNASGEYQIRNGAIVRDKSGNPVYKNQILQPDGTYSAPYKENAFFKGWAQLPTTWPVGPVDLRWDHDAGVWTVGSNYKPLWVVLENDLVNTDPVRGTILEGYSDNTPLPNNFRKLVFVKDGSNLFSAPRGGAIYCKYNPNNGFYEPIYNQPFITSGVVAGGSLATIYKAYNISNLTPDDSTPDSYQTNFTNPLNLNVNINAVGLFIFLNGSWVLQSVKN